MTETPPPPHGKKYLTDKQRAFKRYKDETAATGKPFFPFGVWHDVIAATIVLAIIVGLSVVWFAQANCDSYWNVSCPEAATPAMQEQYHPGEPQKLVLDDEGKPEEGLDGPLLGPLYEDKADPATTSYHPRPEWYFYFLFYLLIVFSNPQAVILGTIGIPTILLVLLIAWPFLDRKRERRPSRRPIAMSAMVAIAVVLLYFTYQGSKAGDEAGPEGITKAQVAMPGYDLIFKDTRGETCFGCHIIAKGSNSIGPDLTTEAAKNRGIEWQIAHLIDPKSKAAGSVMPAQGDTFTPEEIAQLAAFLETLGAPERATDPKYTGASAADTEAAVGDGKVAGGAGGAGVDNDGDNDTTGDDESTDKASETGGVTTTGEPADEKVG